MPNWKLVLLHKRFLSVIKPPIFALVFCMNPKNFSRLDVRGIDSAAVVQTCPAPPFCCRGYCTPLLGKANCFVVTCQIP